MKSLTRLFWLVLATASTTTALAVAIPRPIDPGLSCPMPTVVVGDPVVVYGDQLGSGYFLNVWGGQSTTITDNPYEGNNAIHMHFDTAWSGIEFQSTTLYDSNTVGGVRVAVRGNKSGQNIRIYLLTSDWQKLGLDVPLTDYLVRGDLLPDWQVAYIPLADLLGSTSALIGGVGIQAESAGDLWIDDVQFLPVEPVELLTLFSDHLGDVSLTNWGLALSTTNDTFHGKQAIRVHGDQAWSGLHFHFDQAFNAGLYGSLTFAVKTDVINLDIFPYVQTSQGGLILAGAQVSDYIYGDLNSEWKVVWIPLRDLGLPDAQSAAVTDLYLEFSQAGTVWLDEVKVVENLKWPLPEFPVGNWNGGYRFGAEWDQGADYTCNSLNQLHTATDYSTFGAANKKVVAAHDGIVRYSSAGSAQWGGYVVIESNGNAFVTEYTHITPSVTTGSEVVGGVTQIGVTSSLSEHTPHLHFSLRVKPYSATDLSMVIKGVLPQTDCGGYPKFPEAFVDPELVDWQ